MDENEQNENIKQLLKDAKKGNKDAFGEVVSIYQNGLRIFASRYLQSNEDIYDLVQESFIYAYKNMEKFDTSRNFGPWIRVLCKNKILNFIRSKKVRKNVNIALVDEALVERIADLKEEKDEQLIKKTNILKSCVGNLGEHQKQLINQRYHGELSVKDIAANMDKSAASVAMRFARLRHLLKKCMLNKL